MKLFHVFICLALITMLIWIGRGGLAPDSSTYGGLSWIGWASLATVGLVAGLVFVLNDAIRARGLFGFAGRGRKIDPVRTLTSSELAELGLDKYRGPVYPHPVIFPDRCIGCQACVDACPHDVLAIVDGIAAAVEPDLCMEDTACQAECPVNPKSCIVINTTKPIVSRPAPTRDGATYQTNVPGCYIIGDVSGVPLLKNAVKEGYEVIQHVAADLQGSPADPNAQFDVAIVGIGAAGASAAAAAQERGLRYIAIEQTTVLSTIEAYPVGKHIYFKPDTKDWFGGLPIDGLAPAGDQRENILRVWKHSLDAKGVRVNEFESCRSISPSGNDDHFIVETERQEDKSTGSYRARRVVIAIGLRGAPNRLRLPNEDLKVTIDGREQQKVLYSLNNPSGFRGKRIVIVGGGNVAVEAAVDLVARRIGPAIEPRPPGDMNLVTLLVRDFFAPTVKFGNKLQLYECVDSGHIDLRFGVAIKELHAHEVVLEDVRTGKVIETLANDYVFALIGGERPDRFLQSVGITLT
jgi:thioredoxin reductase (NADPH)